MTNSTQTFSFTSRETYLEYRAQWRAQYAEQSQEIRALKRQIKEAPEFKQPGLQSTLHYARVKANQMNLELAEAKAYAAAQRQAHKLAA